MAEPIRQDLSVLARAARGAIDYREAVAGAARIRTATYAQILEAFAGPTPEQGEAADRLTLDTIARVQEDGVAFMGPAQWRGAWVMRVSVSSMATTDADADESVESVLKAWRAVR